MDYAARTQIRLQRSKGKTQGFDSNEEDVEWEAEMENVFNGTVRPATGRKMHLEGKEGNGIWFLLYKVTLYAQGLRVIPVSTPLFTDGVHTA
jgi:hypothetical protein